MNAELLAKVEDLNAAFLAVSADTSGHDLFLQRHAELFAWAAENGVEEHDIYEAINLVSAHRDAGI